MLTSLLLIWTSLISGSFWGETSPNCSPPVALGLLVLSLGVSGVSGRMGCLMNNSPVVVGHCVFSPGSLVPV